MSTALEEKPSTAVTVVERAALALGAAKHRQDLLALAAESKSITEIKNKAARDQCHSTAMTLKTRRTSIRKAGKDARDDATKFSKAIITEEDLLVAIIEPDEIRLLALRDAWDQVEEAKKIAKALAESQRITKIRLTIDTLRHVPTDFIGKPSAEIGAAADHLSEQVIALDFYAEYTGEAISERDNAVKQLRTMQEAMRAHEFQQAALEAERETLARERAAAEERERVAAEERAAQARKDAAARAEQEAKDRAERERVEAEQRAAQEQAAEAMRVQQQEHQARMQAQQAELDAKQAVIDAAIAEQERVAREAREAAEAVERRRQEEVEATARAEAERIQAVKDAAAAAELAEAARQLAERQAAEAEAERRERVNFIKNGPAPEQIILALADEYRVDAAVVRDWLALRDWKLVEVSA